MQVQKHPPTENKTDIYISQDTDLINAGTCLCMFSDLLFGFLDQSEQAVKRKTVTMHHAYRSIMYIGSPRYSKAMQTQ